MPTSITRSKTVHRSGSLAAANAVSRVRGELVKPTFTALSPNGNVAWGDGNAGGSFAVSGANNSTAVYTPANKSRTVVIFAQDAGGTVTTSLLVWASLPLFPQKGFEITADVETKVVRAKDRTEYMREEGKLGLDGEIMPEISYALAWENRDVPAITELWTFWLWHRKIRQFYIVDTESGWQELVKFETAMKRQFVRSGNWAAAAAVKGRLQNLPIAF